MTGPPGYRRRICRQVLLSVADEQADRNIRQLVDGLPGCLREVLPRTQGANRDVQDKVPVFLVPLTYVEPHEAHVVQGRRELQRCRIERDRQHPVRACACRRVLAEEIADEMPPFVGDGLIARARAPCHPFIDQDHDDFALGIQVNRRGWSAIRLSRPVTHGNTRTIAHRPSRKRPIEAGRELSRLARFPMKQHLDAKRRDHPSLAVFQVRSARRRRGSTFMLN